MPFYVSPEQSMKDKADYARKGIARGRNSVVIQYDAGILFVAPNPSRALHKVSEIYDRIAFAAVGRYNEYENLRIAEVGAAPDTDQIYRITFDGSVADEHGFVAMGGQADQVTAVLKERYAEGLPLASALGVAIAALSGQDGNGERAEIGASQLEVAVLARDRVHRTFRRVGGSRLENLLAEARPGQVRPAGEPPAAEPGTPTG